MWQLRKCKAGRRCSAKLALFIASDNLKESLEAVQYNEGEYRLLHRAGSNRKCNLVTCVDDVLNIPPKSMGVPIGQLIAVLQRYGDRVLSRKTKLFLVLDFYITHEAMAMRKVHMTCSNLVATSVQKLSATTRPLDQAHPRSARKEEMREVMGWYIIESRTGELSMLRSRLGRRCLVQKGHCRNEDSENPSVRLRVHLCSSSGLPVKFRVAAIDSTLRGSSQRRRCVGARCV